MKHYTDEQIIEKCKEIWMKPGVYRLQIRISKNEESGIIFDVSDMYDPPVLNLLILKSLSDFFETDNITTDKFSNKGCETCDYGSSYGFTVFITP